jgi:hypothetical protein
MQSKLLGIINVDFDATGQPQHSSNTGEIMGIQRSSASAIYKLQESL